MECLPSIYMTVGPVPFTAFLPNNKKLFTKPPDTCFTLCTTVHVKLSRSLGVILRDQDERQMVKHSRILAETDRIKHILGLYRFAEGLLLDPEKSN